MKIAKVADQLVGAIVQEVTQRLKGAPAPSKRAPKMAGAGAPGRRGPRSDKEMQCRYPRCRQKSRGPRFHYLCQKHEHMHEQIANPPQKEAPQNG